MAVQQNVTDVVRWCMAARRENQRQLADALGMAAPTLSLKLKGRRTWSLEDVEALAAHYGLNATAFLTEPTALIGPELARVSAASVSVTHGYQRGMALVVDLPTHRIRRVVAAA